jgi:nitrate reductase gamma subunit
MKVFQAAALVVMAGFFVWLLLQMSRTARSDQRLIAMALAFAGVVLAFGLGALLSRRS